MREDAVMPQGFPRSASSHSESNFHSPQVVSFSGVDGSGKSTQIEALCSALKTSGTRFRVIRFWDEVTRLNRFREAASLGIFKSEPGVGVPGSPVRRRDKNVRSWLMTCVRLCLYMFDAFSLRAMMVKASQLNYDVIVFDRYIYDELANLNLTNRLIQVYVRLIMSMVPKPHLSYLLDAVPDEARARKPEYPVEFIRMNRLAYLRLSDMIGGITVIPPMPVEDVKREIMRFGDGVFTGKDRSYAL